MEKVKNALKNIGKWLLFVVLSFTVIFTGLSFGIGNIFGINFFNPFEVVLVKNFFINGNEGEWIEVAESYSERYQKNIGLWENKNIQEIYNQYPQGFIRYEAFHNISYMKVYTYLHSLELAFLIGTALFLLFNKKNKGGVPVLITYLAFVALFGYVQGFEIINAENWLQRWAFPSDYIIGITILFAVVFVVGVIMQKRTAKKLNEELKNKKEESKG